VNNYADSLSRQWDPGDVQETTELLRSLCAAYAPEAVVFRDRPTGKHPVARRKYLETQMSEYWGDGPCRLWNPPLDLLPMVVRKIKSEQAQGVMIALRWPVKPWFAQLEAMSTVMHDLAQDQVHPVLHGTRPVNPHWKLVVAEIGPRLSGGRQSAQRSSVSPARAQLGVLESRLTS
jgi:hypothetical protein